MKTIILGILAVAILNDPFTMGQESRSPSYMEIMCNRNGAADKIEQAKKAVGENLYDCLGSLINVPILQAEIIESKAKGNFKQVFKKYCAESLQFKTCCHTLLDGISPCTDPVERENLPSLKKAADQFIDFVCHNHGDRLAHFFAKGGPQCVQSKYFDINECVLSMFSSLPETEQPRSLTITKLCTTYNGLLTCIAQKLETCDTPVPANMFKALVKYTLNGTPCQVNSK